MGIQKYFTEEEKKAAKREYQKHWREKNPDYRKQYYQKNAEKEKEMAKCWRDANPDYVKCWREKNIEKVKEYKKCWNEANPDYIKCWRENNPDYQKQYSKTPIGRASNLVSSYQQSDKKYNRGECTLTAQWIMDNIFTSKCRWCKETDWKKLGCDRIDNSKPHTPDNVIPCCDECNTKRGTKTYEEFLMSLSGIN